MNHLLAKLSNFKIMVSKTKVSYPLRQAPVDR